MPHLNPLLKEATKRSAAELLGGDKKRRKVEEDDQQRRKVEEIDAKELSEEEIFYSTYIQKSDDMWEALEEEVNAIEKFFLDKNAK